MEIINKAELEYLMNKNQQWCVSIYLPTHRTGVETQQDPIRLKNQLKEAEKLLSAQGVSTRDVQSILEPANTLLQDFTFWQHQSDGLVIFLTANSIRLYRLPLDFKELVVVKNNFYIQPLLPLFTGDGQFYILVLSLNNIRLLNGTRYSISEIDIAQLAGSMDEAISSKDHQVNLQIHSSGAGGGKTGDNSVTFHGQGGGSDESDKTDLLRYFRLVNDGFIDILQGAHIPLVLAGVEYLLPIYKEANSYLNMIDTVIPGNPDLLSDEELHKSAWQILGPLFQAEQEEAIAFYQQLAGQESERVAYTLEKIIPAAYNGQIETLFVGSGLQPTGVFNPATNEIKLHDQPESGDEYLLDLAAGQTYLKGGKVYVIEPEKVPGGTIAAAMLRY